MAFGLSFIAVLSPAGVIYDSGNPAPRDNGDVAFMDVWRVLDPLDNLSVRVVAPIGEFAQPTRVTGFAFYAFSPKDPADKRIEIYSGTGADSAGVLWRSIELPQHSGVRQGWNRVELDEPILFPPGQYGISYHAMYEFHSYWAPNAPRGAGYAWVKLNDTLDWFKGGVDDFGFVPNFAIRIYGVAATEANGEQAAPAGQPRSRTSGGRVAPAPRPQTEQKSPVGQAEAATDTAADGNPHEYEPGTRTEAVHVIWRKDANLTPTGPRLP